MRKRITINEGVYKAAVEYCKFDNRTFSELVQESLKQMMKRYPKEKEYSHESILTLEKLVEKLIEKNKEIKAEIERLENWTTL